VSDLANTPGNKLKMIDHAELVAAMNKKYGNLYVQDVIPKDTYRGMDQDNKQATVQNILVAHESMDEKTAYNIVKTIFDKKADIVAVHKEAENFKLENQKKEATPDPLAPGRGQVLRRKGRQAELTRPLHDRSPQQAERAQLSADIDAAALQKAEEYIEQEEGAANKFKGWLAAFVTLAAVVMSPSTCTRPMPSCRRRRCGRCTWPSCCSCASWCSRSRRAFATA
jgi:hypothetical protein